MYKLLPLFVLCLTSIVACSNPKNQISDSKIFIDDTKSLFTSTRKIADDGREVKEHIKDLFAQCRETRNIDANSVVLAFDNASIQNNKVSCGGTLKTTKRGSFVLFNNIIEDATPIPLANSSPILRYVLPDKQMAVFLPEGYKMEK